MAVLEHSSDTRIKTLSMVVWLVDDFTRKQPLRPINVVAKEKVSDRRIKLIRNLSGHYVFTNLETGQYVITISSDFYFPVKRIYDTANIRDEEISLDFGPRGPAAGATSVNLKDTTELRLKDNVKFYNSIGDIEQRRITDIDNAEKTISWEGELKYDYSTEGSSIRVLDYLVDNIILKPKTSYPFPGDTTLLRGRVLSDEKPVVGADIIVLSQNVENKTDERGEFILFFKSFKADKDELKKGKITIKKGNIIIKIGEEEKPLNNEKVIIHKGKTKSLGGVILP